MRAHPPRATRPAPLLAPAAFAADLRPRLHDGEKLLGGQVHPASSRRRRDSAFIGRADTARHFFLRSNPAGGLRITGGDTARTAHHGARTSGPRAVAKALTWIMMPGGRPDQRHCGNGSSDARREGGLEHREDRHVANRMSSLRRLKCPECRVLSELRQSTASGRGLRAATGVRQRNGKQRSRAQPAVGSYFFILAMIASANSSVPAVPPRSRVSVLPSASTAR